MLADIIFPHGHIYHNDLNFPKLQQNHAKQIHHKKEFLWTVSNSFSQQKVGLFQCYDYHSLNSNHLYYTGVCSVCVCMCVPGVKPAVWKVPSLSDRKDSLWDDGHVVQTHCTHPLHRSDGKSAEEKTPIRHLLITFTVTLICICATCVWGISLLLWVLCVWSVTNTPSFQVAQ